jgi:oligopeptidase B
LLDEAQMAIGLDFFQLGSLVVSPDAQLMAYSTDTTGAERFTLRVRNLRSGAELEDSVELTLGSAVWSADSQGFFYTLINESWRPYVVKYHRLGSDEATDATVYEELDPGFFVGISLTQSRRFVVVSTADHVTSEMHLIPTDEPLTPARLISPRQVNRAYSPTIPIPTSASRLPT